MFIKLVMHEIKYQMKSITFIIFCTFILLFYITQFIGDMDDPHSATHPIEDMQSGSRYIIYSNFEDISNIPLEESKSTLMHLMERDIANRNTPLFDDMACINLTPLTDVQLSLLTKTIGVLQDIAFTEDVYSDTLEQLQQTFGPKTLYERDVVDRFVVKVKNYIQNKQDTEDIRKYEKVTGAYARLFSDYMGIAVGFFAIFIAGFALVKDKRYKAMEMIYTKPISSSKYVLSKYLGNVILMLAVILLIALYTTYDFHTQYDQIDYFAFFKYTLTWILPTIMMVTSIGYLIQVISGNGIVPIIVTFAYWYYSMPFSSNQYHITRYIIRYNDVSTLAKYQEVASAIMVNRLVITGASIVLLMVAMWIFEKKRGNICG